MLNVVVFEGRAEEYKTALEKECPDINVYAATDEAQLAGLVEEMDILLAFRIPDELLQRARRLQWIQSLATGVDYIVNLPSLRSEVLVTSTRGIHGPQMSEMAFLLMLALSRDFPRMVRNQERGIWDRWPTHLLEGKAVAILGVGLIGKEIARKCKAFGMTVSGIDIVRDTVEGVDRFYGPEDIAAAVADADFLLVVAPYTPLTHHIVNADVLARMKPSSFLINIGRGELIDNEALMNALRAGKIAGAALDVFPEEPLPPGHPYWKMENVIVTPHVGGMSDTYVDQALSVFKENLRRFLRGERKDLLNLVTR